MKNGPDRRTVLLAEDDPVNALVATKLLEKSGASVTAVTNGRHAIYNFYKNKYDLVILDISMPRMDGMEAVSLIRQYEKKKGSDPTPVIALTAYGSEADRTRTLNAGFDDHLVKPVTFEVIKEAIEKYCN